MNIFKDCNGQFKSCRLWVLSVYLEKEEDQTAKKKFEHLIKKVQRAHEKEVQTADKKSSNSWEKKFKQFQTVNKKIQSSEKS